MSKETPNINAFMNTLCPLDAFAVSLFFDDILKALPETPQDNNDLTKEQPVKTNICLPRDVFNKFAEAAKPDGLEARIDGNNIIHVKVPNLKSPM